MKFWYCSSLLCICTLCALLSLKKKQKYGINTLWAWTGIGIICRNIRPISHFRQKMIWNWNWFQKYFVRWEVVEKAFLGLRSYRRSCTYFWLVPNWAWTIKIPMYFFPSLWTLQQTKSRQDSFFKLNGRQDFIFLKKKSENDFANVKRVKEITDFTNKFGTSISFEFAYYQENFP